MTGETKVRIVEIGSNEEGQRLDNFLMKELKGVPKSRIYRLLRKGEVRVNKKRKKPSDRLSAGDQVRLPPIRVAEPAKASVPGQNLRELLESSILFEDEALLVIDKPTGLAVHGGSGLALGLIESLRAIRPEHEYLELIHRIDRETSGCLMLARSRKALVKMHEEMRNGGVRKEYEALTVGKWPSHLNTVDAPLQKNELSSGERIVRVDQEGKHAETHFSVLQRYPGATLVRARLGTGRTHQIRVHTQLSGHSIAGDEKYGDKDAKAHFRKMGLRRLFLHAAFLEFRHPLSGDLLSIESPLPADLKTVLNNLSS